ncbi:MAG: hypothetical protein AB7Q29_08170 [Vicinamibacterales bacterium]
MHRLTWASAALSAAIPACLFAYGGYLHRWAGDDGFINFRVVSQLLAGNGFVFNAGERSEAVTSAGWVFVLWALGSLGFNVEDSAWMASLLLGALGVGLAAATSARLWTVRELEPVAVLPYGAIVYAAIPVAWDYATSALENGLGLGFLGAAYWTTASAAIRTDARSLCAAAAFVGLAPLVRPDYAIYAVPLTLLLMISARGWREAFRVGICAGAAGTGYEIFRMGYFAALIPNTAFAKEAFEARWDQGVFYLMNTIQPYWLVVPLFLLVPCLAWHVASLLRRECRAVALLPLAMAGAGLLHVLYVVRVGGDFMHGRLLLPGLFAVSSAAAVVAIPDSTTATRRRLVLAGFAVLSVWAIACAALFRVDVYDHLIVDERRWYAERSIGGHPTRLEHYTSHPFYEGAHRRLNRIAAGCPRGFASLSDTATDACVRVALPDPLEGTLSGHPAETQLPLREGAAPTQIVSVFGFRPLGISSRAAGLRINVVDGFGLADPVAARLELAARGRPGHEKSFSSAWFAAKYAAPGASTDEDVTAAARALECGLLRELHKATREPLTLMRFAMNIRLAFALHRLRVPEDPHEAVSRLCTPA